MVSIGPIDAILFTVEEQLLLQRGRSKPRPSSAHWVSWSNLHVPHLLTYTCLTYPKTNRPISIHRNELNWAPSAKIAWKETERQFVRKGLGLNLVWSSWDPYGNMHKRRPAFQLRWVCTKGIRLYTWKNQNTGKYCIPYKKWCTKETLMGQLDTSPIQS